MEILLNRRIKYKDFPYWGSGQGKLACDSSGLGPSQFLFVLKIDQMWLGNENDIDIRVELLPKIYW